MKDFFFFKELVLYDFTKQAYYAKLDSFMQHPLKKENYFDEIITRKNVQLKEGFII